MSKHEVLNNVDHKNLRVNAHPGNFPGNRLMCTLAIPSEFRDLQGEYPIFLHREKESGHFLPMVMFGLEKDENLYLGENDWKASYLPLMIARGPFLIGFQESQVGDQRQKTMVISIDIEDERVNDAEGEPLFQPFGGNSGYTDHIAGILQRIDEGQADIKQLCQELERHDLIEPFTLELELDNGLKHKLDGFYAIHEERLASLDGNVLAEFSRTGILQACYMMIASLSNIRRLVEFKNARL